MRLRGLALLAIAAASPSLVANEPQAARGPFTPASLAQFLAQYDKGLDPVDAAFAQLESANLPLLDESGHPLERRTITDRRKEVADVRDSVRRLATSPQDLVATMTLYSRGEKLMDDLYDLSQIAYDNDEEELGKRLTALLAGADRNQELMESYTLSLAEEKEDRLRKLEGRNQELEKKLGESPGAPKSKSPPK